MDWEEGVGSNACSNLKTPVALTSERGQTEIVASLAISSSAGPTKNPLPHTFCEEKPLYKELRLLKRELHCQGETKRSIKTVVPCQGGLRRQKYINVCRSE